MTACFRAWPTGWRRVAARAACIGLLLASLASVSAAQTLARVHVGAGLGLDLLVGDASDFLDGGGSRYLQADFRVTDDEWFHVRLDGAFIGLDDDEGFGDVVADNGVALVTLGPQLTLPLGRWRPYGGLLLGSALVGRSADGSFGGEDVDYEESDAAFAFGGFAGLGVVLDEGDHPVGIRIEGRVLDVGPAAFARAGPGRYEPALRHDPRRLRGARPAHRNDARLLMPRRATGSTAGRRGRARPPARRAACHASRRPGRDVRCRPGAAGGRRVPAPAAGLPLVQGLAGGGARTTSAGSRSCRTTTSPTSAGPARSTSATWCASRAAGSTWATAPPGGADIWWLAKKMIGVLDDIGCGFVEKRPPAIIHPFQSPLIGDSVESSYANPQTDAAHVIENSRSDHFDAPSAAHELMHLWACQHSTGEKGLAWRTGPPPSTATRMRARTRSSTTARFPSPGGSCATSASDR